MSDLVYRLWELDVGIYDRRMRPLEQTCLEEVIHDLPPGAVIAGAAILDAADDQTRVGDLRAAFISAIAQSVYGNAGLPPRWTETLFDNSITPPESYRKLLQRDSTSMIVERMFRVVAHRGPCYGEVESR